jgi:hypothetical protein
MTTIQYLVIFYVGLCVFRPFRVLMSLIMGLAMRILGWCLFLVGFLLAWFAGLAVEMSNFLEEGH